MTCSVRHTDALAGLQAMPEGCVDCCVTSPPYWGLRDYGEGTATVWDGDPNCPHEWGDALPAAGARSNDSAPGAKETPGAHTDRDKRQRSAFCQLCGAWYGQLGLEPHPSLFLEHLWAIFDEVQRVLKPTGTCFVVMGDSYCSLKGSCYNPGGGANSLGQNRKAAGVHPGNKGDVPEADRNWLRPKQLLLIPSRFAIGLQERGWLLRNDIVWHKPNPMPASARDRFTCAWEHVFMFARSGRYFFNMEDSLEVGATGAWEAMPPIGGVKQTEGSGNETYSGNRPASNGMRQPRDVWTLNTACFPAAHFAVYPEALVKKALLAGCPPHVCGKCGKPWGRNVERGEPVDHPQRRNRKVPALQFTAEGNQYKAGGYLGKVRAYEASGWHPTCFCAGRETCGNCGGSGWVGVKRIEQQEGETRRRCSACKGKGEVGLPGPWQPGLVLDPFCGTGTTGVVAVELGLRFSGLEINAEYVEMAARRIADAQSPLLEVAR